MTAQAARMPASRPGVGTVNGHVLRLAEWLIKRACRQLPKDASDERYREWTTELPEILHDPEVRFALRRAVRTLLFAADQSRGTRPLRQARIARRKRTNPAGEAVSGVIHGVIGVIFIFGAVFGVDVGIGDVRGVVGGGVGAVVGAVIGLASAAGGELAHTFAEVALRRMQGGGA